MATTAAALVHRAKAKHQQVERLAPRPLYSKPVSLDASLPEKRAPESPQRSMAASKSSSGGGGGGGGSNGGDGDDAGGSVPREVQPDFSALRGHGIVAMESEAQGTPREPLLRHGGSSKNATRDEAFNASAFDEDRGAEKRGDPDRHKGGGRQEQEDEKEQHRRADGHQFEGIDKNHRNHNQTGDNQKADSKRFGSRPFRKQRHDEGDQEEEETQGGDIKLSNANSGADGLRATDLSHNHQEQKEQSERGRATLFQ